MIVNEIAKFENPDIPRRSSCAYPRAWRIRRSLSSTWSLTSTLLLGVRAIVKCDAAGDKRRYAALVRSVLAIAAALLALSAAGCGRPAQHPVLRSERATQQPRSVGLGVRAAPAAARRRCLARASWTATPDLSYAGVVRTTATAYARGPGSPVVGRFEHLDVNGFPTVFSILGARLGAACKPAWYRVRLSVRPNGKIGRAS